MALHLLGQENLCLHGDVSEGRILYNYTALYLRSRILYNYTAFYLGRQLVISTQSYISEHRTLYVFTALYLRR
jgi:hypothetical protein